MLGRNIFFCMSGMRQDDQGREVLHDSRNVWNVAGLGLTTDRSFERSFSHGACNRTF